MILYIRNFFLTSLIFFQIQSFSSQTLSSDENKLYELIMEYRIANGLPIIPLSESLTIVAQTHVKDLYINHPNQGNCNLHSWSSNGNWTPCCYTSDHAQADKMWSKPRELTSYKGSGFEIAYAIFGCDATPEGSLNGWKSSSGHNAVLLNEGMWNQDWKAIGVGMFKGYAVVWFGHESE